MQKLISGLHQFQKEIVHPQREFFARLAQGQRPEALFITCSDSRVNPNLITQTKPGDLFIVRNAGNIIPPYGQSVSGEVATIEYAVAALGVEHIIVCGHSHCGAMGGLIKPEALTDLPMTKAWLNHAESTRRILKDNYSHLSGEALLNVAVQENVLVQLEHLRTQPVVASALVRGAMRLHAWIYKIETGEVFAFDPEKGQFAPITETSTSAHNGTDGEPSRRSGGARG